jgi:rhodanese-related sulfurtransferase
VALGAGTIAAVIAQPDLLRPSVQAGLPIAMMANLPLLGNAVLAAEAKQIRPIDLKVLLTDPTQPILLVDVRTPAEFARGHLPGAVSVPVSTIASGEGLAVIRSQLANRQLVTYCHSGVRSHQALHQLRQVGITGTNLTGGIVAWQQQIDPQMPAPQSSVPQS